MIALLLLLPVLATPDPAPALTQPHPVEVAWLGLPKLTGLTVKEALTRLNKPQYTNIELMIRDPAGKETAPDPSDYSEFIKYQDPPEAHTLPVPIPAGYVVAVILDPGGESPAVKRMELVTWVTLAAVIALFLLWWKTHKHMLGLKPKG